MSCLISIGKILTPTNSVAGVKLAEMGFRPAITMSNTEIPEDTRKYTAVREFFTEFFGFATTLTIGNLVERAGGQLFAKKISGKFLNKEEFKDIAEKAFNTLSDANQKIKAGILVSSVAGAVIAGAIITPVLNNIVLNKLMDKIIKKKDNKNKLPEITNNKEENIFSKYDKLVKNKV